MFDTFGASTQINAVVVHHHRRRRHVIYNNFGGDAKCKVSLYLQWPGQGVRRSCCCEWVVVGGGFTRNKLYNGCCDTLVEWHNLRKGWKTVGLFNNRRRFRLFLHV